MKTKTIIRIALCLLSIPLITLLGCIGKPFHYSPPSEIPEGPGVLSGKKGEFTLYDSKSGKVEQKIKTAPEAAAPEAKKPGAKKTGDVVTTGDKMTDSKEYREFQEFQEWKKSKQDAKEYQDFQQWKKWKEFKKWQENQQ